MITEDGELTDRYDEILTEMFENFMNPKTLRMDEDQFRKLIEKAQGSLRAAKVTPEKIQKIWKQHWVPPRNRLLKEGFYQMMTSIARNNEDEMWRDLHSLAFDDTGLRFADFRSRV